jgi:hypothetical protein
MKNEELIRKAIERFEDSSTEDQEEREFYDDDVKFAINYEECQWPEEMRQSRLNDSPPRPCLVINKIPEKIDQVEGEFRQLEASIKVRPIDDEADIQTAEIYGGLIRHIQYHSTARSAYNHAHTSVLYGGRGAWRIDIEEADEDPFIKDIKVNRIPNVLTVYWDKSAKKEDKSDAQYWFITEKMPLEKFKAKFPKASLDDWDAANTPQDWQTEKMVRVAEYWWKEDRPVTFFRVERVNPETGEEHVLTVKEDDKKRGDKILEEKTVNVPKVRWGILNHNEFLEGPYDDWPSRYIPIILETGKEINVNGEDKSRGMVRFGKGPQQMYNFWSTATTEQIALIPKSPYLLTPKMIKDFKNQWDNAAWKNFMYLLYNPDPTVPGGRPTREAPPQLSTAYAHELARMEHDIMSAMGIYQAQLGDEGQEKSGKAILARQRQGSIGSYTFTDKFENALVYSTKIIMDLIPHVYDTERIIRITGEDGTDKEVPINAVPNGTAMRRTEGIVTPKQLSIRPGVTDYINDLTVGKYDVAVTVGPSYTTERQEAAAVLLDLVQAIPQLGMATVDLIVKNLDIKDVEELVERARKLVPVGIRDPEPGEEEQQQQQPPDPQIMIEMQKLLLAQQEENRKEFEARVKAIKDLAEAESKERGSQLAEFTAVVNQLRMDMQLPQQTNQTGQGVSNAQGRVT